MKGKTPFAGSGKTRFNREKPKGKSWIALREEARKAGTYHSPKAR